MSFGIVDVQVVTPGGFEHDSLTKLLRNTFILINQSNQRERRIVYFGNDNDSLD